jgi:hypothetical protein
MGESRNSGSYVVPKFEDAAEARIVERAQKDRHAQGGNQPIPVGTAACARGFSTLAVPVEQIEDDREKEELKRPASDRAREQKKRKPARFLPGRTAQ